MGLSQFRRQIIGLLFQGTAKMITSRTASGTDGIAGHSGHERLVGRYSTYLLYLRMVRIG